MVWIILLISTKWTKKSQFNINEEPVWLRGKPPLNKNENNDILRKEKTIIFGI
jgi:hypothetical protein